ncbi:MAG: folylpolyglutamate synthase/dihydrofolate synthase family protein [Lentimicrobium sp.]
MDYQQTLDYLFSRFPTFHLIGAPAYKANLDNTLEICRLINHPYEDFLTVHVAGTNGKGSVSHMLASVLQESGFKTALFTSPHLKDFRERIKVNGEMVPEQVVIDFVEQHQADFEKLEPSFFEMSFGLAMKWFSDSKADIAVIETGMGGRLDSTNVITPLLSVITNIGLDHTQFLGNTIAEIAREKAGIIKPGVPVVIGETDQESAEVFLVTAAENHAEITFADQEVEVRRKLSNTDITRLKVTITGLGKKSTLDCPLTGDYQLKNLATVFAAVKKLEALLPVLSHLKLEAGIKNTIQNTGLKGRWHTLKENPLTICDIGHNPHGLRLVVDQIKSIRYEQLHFVIGVVNDKDISTMLSMLPEEAIYYFCKASIPRGLDAGLLQAEANPHGLKGEKYESVKDALNAAWKAAGEKDLVFIGGSTFTVAEVI